MEGCAAGWYILNTHEIIRRLLETRLVPELGFLQIYMPNPPLIYTSAGHRVAILGSAVAQTLVEYHTRLERVMERTKRICSLDPRRVKKEARLANFEECFGDWGYVAWACGESLDALLEIARPALTADQQKHTVFFIKYLNKARSGDADWSLPSDAIVGIPTEARDEK